MMEIYLPIKFEFDWSNVDKQMDGQTDEKQTNERTEFHQYRKEPTYDGDLSPYQV